MQARMEMLMVSERQHRTHIAFSLVGHRKKQSPVLRPQK